VASDQELRALAPPELPDTIQAKIAMGFSPDGLEAIAAIRESSGLILYASDREVLAAQQKLGACEGIYAEPSAAAAVDKFQQDGRRLIIDSRYAVGIPWQGPAIVNGRVWPVRDQSTLWLPAGPNVIEPAQKDPPVRLFDFNGNLHSATPSASGLQFSYESSARAAAVLNTRPRKLEIDGTATDAKILESGANFVILLPRGQHVVQIAP
jgi:hypothetical protein